MKSSSPCKASFIDCLKAAPQKIYCGLQKEVDALTEDPLRYLRNGFVKNGRAIGGICYLAGDLSLPASPTAGTLLKGVGLMSAPATMLFLTEPLLGKRFGTNDQQQPLVPVGSYKINTTKLAYNTMGASCAGIALDGLLKIPQQGWPAVVQTGATLIAAWGCFQAGNSKKQKPVEMSHVSEEERKEPFLKSLKHKIGKIIPEETVVGKLFRDQEFSGITKLLMENVPMITAAAVMANGSLLRAYLCWTAGNLIMGARRGVEMLFKRNKDDITQPASMPKSLILEPDALN